MAQSMPPVQVLHVLTGLSSGGAEAFIMNMYRNIDRSKVQFDFLLRSEENIYAEELAAMGSRVYKTPSFPRHALKNAIATARFFREHHYDIVHVHANALLYLVALQCAQKNGVRCRIIHSHNSAMAHMQLLPIHNFNKKRIHRLATDFFACSEDAGHWMFAKPYKVIKNAIDLDAFSFNAKTRAKARAELGIDDTDFVIGHSGRFAEQKNHAFLLEVFGEILKQRNNVKLLLLGDGKLRAEMELKAAKLGIAHQVLFLGSVKNVSDYLNAMDIFLFPSLYEGLAISLIEAQANGLPIMCSDRMVQEALVDASILQLPLDIGAEYWANQALRMDPQRREMTESLRTAGYDIRQQAAELQNFYLLAAKDNK